MIATIKLVETVAAMQAGAITPATAVNAVAGWSVSNSTVWKLKHIADLVAKGELRGQPRFANSVPLDIDDVQVSGSAEHLRAYLSERIMDALDETVRGARQLWFAADGSPMMAFEADADRVLFRLRI